MKKKIINIIADILLITVAFAITDILMIKVFHSESMWLELLIYIVLYGIVFGSKHGLTILWKRFASNKKETEEEK